MKVRYSIDTERRLILTSAKGWVTFDDVRAHQDRLLADPDFDRSFDQLIDATATTRFDISPDQAQDPRGASHPLPESRTGFLCHRAACFLAWGA